MTLLAVFLITILILCVIGYGIKLYFDAKRNRNLETSNRPVTLAISAILAGLFMMIGFPSFAPELLVQCANQCLGLDIKMSPNNQLINTLVFVIFCLTIPFTIYSYYKNRHLLYLQENSKDKPDTVESFIIDNRKAKIKNQNVFKDNTGDIYF